MPVLEINALTDWYIRHSCLHLIRLWTNRAVGFDFWCVWTDTTTIKSDVQQLSEVQRNMQTSLNDLQQLLRELHQNLIVGTSWLLADGSLVIILTTAALGRLSIILSSDDHESFACWLSVKSLMRVKNYLRGFYRNNSTIAG